MLPKIVSERGDKGIAVAGAKRESSLRSTRTTCISRTTWITIAKFSERLAVSRAPATVDYRTEKASDWSVGSLFLMSSLNGCGGLQPSEFASPAFHRSKGA